MELSIRLHHHTIRIPMDKQRSRTVSFQISDRPYSISDGI
ncbi:hypothetical protein A2U01_0075029, partial [Trifolium medium]|nr:hypothetical protein [Trifolium medium]